VTRTVRIEVPARANTGRSSRLDRLVKAASSHEVSELFLISQSRPYIRAAGDIRILSEEPVLQPADVEALIADLTPEPWREAVRRGDPAEWLIDLADIGRVRCSSFRDHRGPGAVFRFSASQAASAEQMGLGDDAVMLATEPEGLVVVSGPAASDRSAVSATFVDIINDRRGDYVVAIQRQVRNLHENRHALISQREVGSEPARMAKAISAALRENPDVLVVEDLSTADVAALVLEAAREERLVIVSVEAPTAAAAVQRFVTLLPEQDRAAARETMARVFRGAIAQLTVRRAAGGRIAARELLAGTRSVSALIGDAGRPDLGAALEAGREPGSKSIADVLAGYVSAGTVDVREAFRKAPDPTRLLASLRASGVDVSAVERLG